MKRIKANVIVLTICMLLLISASGIVSAVSPNEDPAINLDSNSIGLESVAYDHASILNVKETITNLGGGTWKYSYEFTNTESTPIWQFIIWTTFTTNAQTVFAQTPTWSADGHDITSLGSIYDARNLNPNIKWMTHTWASSWPITTDGIAAGKSVSGFSYTANVYDASPKYYAYDVSGSYEGDSGKVTGFGMTGAPTPTITISTDKLVYSPGETIKLKINIQNPTSNTYSSSVVLKMTSPDNKVKTLGQKSLTMTSGFNVEKIIPIKIPTSIPRGAYKFTATLNYGGSSASSSASFTI